MNDDDDIISEWLQFISQFQWKNRFCCTYKKSWPNHSSKLRSAVAANSHVLCCCCCSFFLKHKNPYQFRAMCCFIADGCEHTDVSFLFFSRHCIRNRGLCQNKFLIPIDRNVIDDDAARRKTQKKAENIKRVQTKQPITLLHTLYDSYHLIASGFVA